MVEMMKSFDVAKRCFKGQHLKKAFYEVQKKGERNSVKNEMEDKNI